MRRVPPPPPPRRRKRPPAPKPAQTLQRVAEAQVASAHVNRVTLNILRHAKSCPEDLRPVLDKWAIRYEFVMDRLSRAERELIFALVTDEVADRALGEFEAVPQGVHDNRWDRTHCKLCGHNPIRFEFDLVNIAGGRSLRTGSVCIFNHKINVRGAETRERAMELIKESRAAAERVADRADWLGEYPDHEEDFDYLRDLRKSLFRHRTPYQLWTYLDPQWQDRCKKVISRLDGAIKYYDKWGYLTDTRTEHVYGAAGLLDCPLVPELNKAIKARKEAVAKWERFRDRARTVATQAELETLHLVIVRGVRHPDLSSYERAVVDAVARKLRSEAK